MLIKLIFVVSFLGILAMIFKRVPQLSGLSLESEKLEEEKEPVLKRKFFDIENWEKKFSLSLGKLFKKIRIFSLKLEIFSAQLSKKFQDKSKSPSKSEKDYWKKFKTDKSSGDKSS